MALIILLLIFLSTLAHAGQFSHVLLLIIIIILGEGSDNNTDIGLDHFCLEEKVMAPHN